MFGKENCWRPVSGQFLINYELEFSDLFLAQFNVLSDYFSFILVCEWTVKPEFTKLYLYSPNNGFTVHQRWADDGKTGNYSLEK